MADADRTTGTAPPTGSNWPLDAFLWTLGSLCALHRLPFAADLVAKQFPPPYDQVSLIEAGRALGFQVQQRSVEIDHLAALPLPCVLPLDHQPALLASAAPAPDPAGQPSFMLCRAGEQNPQTITKAALAALAFESGNSATLDVILFATAAPTINDPDAQTARASQRAFGFRWFIPELFKHKQVWRDVLIASLVIQLLALGTPLFTQAIVDKVVVHRTESTLIVIGIGLFVFMLFSAFLTWARQYLVLHTGNRVDATLGAAVFEHLFKLPPRYFEHRPTGVIAARLHGVETIREFVASSIVTLLLDIPFLFIFVAIMFFYSVTLTLIALGILAVITGISLLMAPVFQARLQEQFLLGARSQAFVTEYVAGLETVKSLQLEPQIKQKYADYLATYLQAGFRTRQISNTYSSAANFLEQLMTLLILVVGAYLVMTPPDAASAAQAAAATGSNPTTAPIFSAVKEPFTIGMLIAFQMFAGKLSQPVLRLVGLWQQFQQARLSVERLGDIMNAPTEPYSLLPARAGQKATDAAAPIIEVTGLGFRHADDLPLLYRDFSFSVTKGEVVALMGPSGSGKSTFAKLLQGFYQPTDGRIVVEGTDIHHLAANELRATFGVVPQETVLFSGTIYDNLAMANPHASFDDIVKACRMAEIHSTIEALPKGYQNAIGERGAGLSGGQRQRLAIARALIRRPKVLIFDEATSALDAETAEHFGSTINQLRGHVTMLFITHAVPKSLKVDRIVRIEAQTASLPTSSPSASPPPTGKGSG